MNDLLDLGELGLALPEQRFSPSTPRNFTNPLLKSADFDTEALSVLRKEHGNRPRLESDDSDYAEDELCSEASCVTSDDEGLLRLHEFVGIRKVASENFVSKKVKEGGGSSRLAQLATGDLYVDSAQSMQPRCNQKLVKLEHGAMEPMGPTQKRPREDFFSSGYVVRGVCDAGESYLQKRACLGDDVKKEASSPFEIG